MYEFSAIHIAIFKNTNKKKIYIIQTLFLIPKKAEYYVNNVFLVSRSAHR